jgi:hypothetical protein
MIKIEVENFFVTGSKSRNESGITNQLLAKTFNVFSFKNFIKNNEENNIKIVSSGIKEKAILDDQKLHSTSPLITQFNKFVVDKSYLKNICDEFLKNNKKMNQTKTHISRTPSKLKTINEGRNSSMKKRGKVHSLTSIDFFNQKNTKLFKLNVEDTKKIAENNVEKSNLKTINNIRYTQDSKRKNMKEEKFLSKFQLDKINKFKVKFN